MKKFTFSEPVIYPSKKDGGYKDNEGKPITKWFIRYKITFDDSRTEYRKEYGASYGRKLNTFKTIKDKEIQAAILLGLVLHDLESGVDPANRDKEIEEKIKREIIEAEQYKYLNIFNQWCAYKNLNNPIPSKENTARNLKLFHINQFIPFLERIGKGDNIKKITDDDINLFIKEKYDAGVWGAFSANTRIAWISGVFTYAHKIAKVIDINPMLLVNKINEDKVITIDNKPTLKQKKEVRFNIYTDKEIELIFERWYNTPYEAICKTVYYGFVRFSELFRLKLSNVDLENNCFNIPASIAKGQRDGRTMKVKIYPQLKEVLERYILKYFGDDQNPDYYLFWVKKPTNPMGYTAFNYHYLQLLKELKAENIEIHKTTYAFKHSGAKRFIAINKKKNFSSYELIEELMRQMRHQDFSTTQKYLYNDLGIELDAETNFSFD
ncbi:site-specific integrase [Pedobacter agri]|uniref:tyrosine-type recombinase/integrase n=1 Tax=Pedobacter agri TaxID=454586 RepID=UPI00293140C5|nr:site-specific integrase [Pedobacter agri]